jgi:hypothetical protein
VIKLPAVLHGEEKDAYETGAVGVYAIGTKMITPCGSIFRYASLGTTTNAGNKLYQSSVPDNNWITQTHTIAITVGATFFSFDDGGTAFTKNQMAGGTVLLEETGDLGHIYQIKANDVTVNTETIMYLEDGVSIQVAMAVAANNVLTAILNPWREIVISPASINTAGNCGIPRISITDAEFGWIQTRGVASCVIDSDSDVVTYGTQLRASEDDVGAVALREESAGVMDYQCVGYALETAPNLDFGHIFLRIE